MSCKETQSVYGQALITIPSTTRVGVFPTLCVLAVFGIIFAISFQNYFHDFSMVLGYNLILPPDVLDVLVPFSLPCSFLFAFIFSQVRIRLNLHAVNTWSIIYTVIALLDICQCIAYIVGRPEEVLSFFSNATSTQDMETTINFLKKMQNPTIKASYNDPTSAYYMIAMYLASFSIAVQFILCLIFCTMACSLYGESQAIMTIQENIIETKIHAVYKQPKMCGCAGKKVKGAEEVRAKK